MALVKFVTTHPGTDDASGKLAILRSVIRDSTSADTDNATASKHVLQRKRKGTKVGASVYDTFG